MDLVTGDRMREMDRRTIEGGFVSGLELMERAGRGILRSILGHVPLLHRRRIVIICGTGNNGGDGLVLARLLRRRGLWPEVWMTAPPGSLRGDAAVNATRALDSRLLLRQAGEREMRRLARLAPEDLVVDALLGTGITGPAKGRASEWISALGACPARIAAVDIPSGLSADSGVPPGEAVRAEWTVTMAFPKPGFLFPPGRGLAGSVDVVDIGIPETVRDEVGVEAHLPEPPHIAAQLPDAGRASHKGDWGKIVIVGGSPGLTGAMDLAARGALRTGAGLVRAALPASLAAEFKARLSEAMALPLPEGEDGQALSSGADEILRRYGEWDALVLGPGLGRSPESSRLVMRLFGRWRGPVLVDADGLNAMAEWGPDSWVPRARDVRAAGEPGGCVLTPHPGEMSRLTGRPVPDLLKDPVGTAREWAERWGVTLVLKGAPSVIGAPDGRVWVNPTGHSGLATGGSGDVLSGMIGALLGQGLSGPAAATVGCYLHGLSAELATRNSARRSLLPTDLAEGLGAALLHAGNACLPPGYRWRAV